MKILIVNFNSVKNLSDEEIECIAVDECPGNTCDCGYNCSNDDDCTSDTY